MKIAIVTAVWQRHDVFEMFAEGIHKLEKSTDHKIITIVAGSEGDLSMSLVRKHGFHYIEKSNGNLALKHNATLHKAESLGAEYVLCLGSDDIITPELFKIYEQKMAEKFDFIGVLDFYFYDLVSKKSLYWGGYIDNRVGHTCGAGRCFSRKLLNKMDWQLWHPKHNRVLDNTFQDKIGRIRPKSYIFKMKDFGVYGIDIKSEVNMTPFDQWQNSEFIDSKELIPHL